MANRKLLRARILIERFLQKALRRNEPLESYRKTDTFKAFQGKMDDIIKEQYVFVREHLSDIKIWDNEDLQEHQVEVLIKNYLDHFMPTFKSKMDQATVYDNLLAGFTWAVKASYERLGVKLMRKSIDYTIDFELTNQAYLDSLNDDARYLLNTKSLSYDQTTKDRLVNLVRDGRMNRDTIDEISSDILADDNIEGVSSVRSFMIANTETANAFGNANQAFLEENNVPQKQWVTAGSDPCPECQENEDEGPINSDDTFPSGDDSEPAHPNCECYVDGVGLDLTTMSSDELDALVLWDGS